MISFLKRQSDHEHSIPEFDTSEFDRVGVLATTDYETAPRDVPFKCRRADLERRTRRAELLSEVANAAQVLANLSDQRQRQAA